MTTATVLVRTETPLEDQITELAAHIHAANYQLLYLLAEFDEQGGWQGQGLKSLAHGLIRSARALLC